MAADFCQHIVPRHAATFQNFEGQYFANVAAATHHHRLQGPAARDFQALLKSAVKRDGQKSKQKHVTWSSDTKQEVTAEEQAAVGDKRQMHAATHCDIQEGGAPSCGTSLPVHVMLSEVLLRCWGSGLS